MHQALPSLVEVLSTKLGPRGVAASQWLERVRAAAGLDAAIDESRFYSAYSSAARELGKNTITLTAEQSQIFGSPELGWRVDQWGQDELGRVILLGSVFARAPGERALAIADECWARGDNRERQAILRALPLVGEGEAALFVPLAVEACRSSVQTIFEAVCCENAFPAKRFPELHFNQMVLKAIFTGAALSRVVGLGPRITAELGRMAEDYAKERRAAGRSVPADVDMVIANAKG